MSKMNGAVEQHDFIDEGFHRLDKEIVKDHPPRISWGPIYKSKNDKDKVQYLEKLASAMNHAAFLIQNERNTLGELVEQKEEQIIVMKAALDQNNTMIQGEITKMNAERQNYNKAVADLKAKVRVLENGDHN